MNFIQILLFLFLSVLAVNCEENDSTYNEINQMEQFVQDSPYNDDDDTSIGRRPMPRIIGAEANTDQLDFAFQVGIMSFDAKNNSRWCGGSLLTNEWILTAAHCLKGRDWAKVYLGYDDLRRAGPSARTSPVTSANFILHSQHNGSTKKNDIALIKLINPAKLSSTIKTIPLMTSLESDRHNGFVGATVNVSGWGSTSNTETKIFKLHHARVQIIDQKTCQESFKITQITSTHICQSGLGQIGTCEGDSGGPMVVAMNGKSYLLGVTSFMGNEGCESEKARVFTRVSEYTDWIRNNINQ